MSMYGYGTVPICGFSGLLSLWSSSLSWWCSSCGISEDNSSLSRLRWLVDVFLAVMRWRVLTISANVTRGFTSIPIPMPFEISIERADLFFRSFNIFLKTSVLLNQKSLPEKSILGSTLSRSFPSPTVSKVMQMRLLHEERRRQGLSAPTIVSVGSCLHSIQRVPSVHGGSRIYFEHHV